MWQLEAQICGMPKVPASDSEMPEKAADSWSLVWRPNHPALLSASGMCCQRGRHCPPGRVKSCPSNGLALKERTAALDGPPQPVADRQDPQASRMKATRVKDERAMILSEASPSKMAVGCESQRPPAQNEGPLCLRTSLGWRLRLRRRGRGGAMGPPDCRSVKGRSRRRAAVLKAGGPTQKVTKQMQHRPHRKGCG